MILVISHDYLPVLSNSIYLESINEKLCERAGFFRLHSHYAHLFAKALVADSLVPLSRVEDIVSCLSDVSGELFLEKAEALIPEPLTQIVRYLRKFFWLNKPLFSIIPGLENTSLVSLLSLLSINTSAENIIVPYRQYDSKILETVVRELERKFTIHLTVDKLTYQTAHLLRYTREIWIGPDCDLQAFLKLRILQPALEREIEPYTKMLVGEDGHYTLEKLEVEWAEKKPYKILVKEPNEIDYLEIIFEKDKVPRVATLLHEILSSSSLTEKNIFDIMRELSLSLRDYYKLIKYGFIETVSAPGGRNICPSLKTLKIYHFIELYAKKYVEEEGRE